MLGGDISAKRAPTIGIRFEGILWQENQIDPVAKSFLEKLDCNVAIITLFPERKVKAKCYKYAIPYWNVFGVDSILEIPNIVDMLGIQIYYDTDQNILNNIRRAEVKLWTYQEVS